ncbi:mitochondrial pyruvate carrier 2-like [Teleopsis dalmanni]|uniref:mitochondrial pyruvate carrier 2-like n=1 Tax=Teleopsis dalmanni TaxID=139649 RepID=UPI0018CC84AC|nr:mitochondrial pyruvate carrier 2-like [Teleopsis dalmanni]
MGLPSKIYNGIISVVDPLVPKTGRAFWEHPAGPKTVFFWAPLFKWGLVIAGIKDLKRPVEKLSINQSVVLAMTGFIWSRYSVVIIPKNYSLLSVNLFVGLSQLYQATRAINYRMSQKDASSE